MGLDPDQIDHEPTSIRFGNGGWLRASYLDGELYAFARMAMVGAKLELVDQYLRRRDGGPLRSDERSTVQWGRLVVISNLPDVLDLIVRRIDLPGPDLARAAASFATSYGGQVDHWVAGMMHAQIDEDQQAPWPGGQPDGRARARGDAPDPWRSEPPTGVLEVPEARPYGVDFYQQVAITYTNLKAHGIAPNSAMAAANKIPKSTADRWVREARRRGSLEPAPRGNPVTRW